MKDKIREILWNFVAGEVTDSEATQQVLDLFAVTGENENMNTQLNPHLRQTNVSGSASDCQHHFVIKFGVYECQNCGIEHSELIKSHWKNCPRCKDVGVYGELVTGEGYCNHCNYRGAF